MKQLPLFLSASLLANLLLGLVYLFGDSVLESSRLPASGLPPKAGVAAGGTSIAPSRSAAAVPAVGQPPAIALAATPQAVRDRLRMLGLPEDVVRATLTGLVSKRYQERAREAMEAWANRGDRHYWEPESAMDRLFPVSAAAMDELRELSRQYQAELKQLLGPEPPNPYTTFVSRREFLSPEKAQALGALETDYTELRLNALREVQGFATGADEKKLQLLQEEKERDLAALLTPEEKAAYDRRQSAAANMLRSRLTYFDASPQEFETLYRLQSELEKKAPLRSDLMSFGGGMTEAETRARGEAQMAMARQVEKELGPERYAAYQRAQQRDYQVARAAAERFGLPVSAADQVYALREQAVRNSQQIIQNSQLPAAAQSAALAQLASDTRRQVRSTLGGNIGEAYLKQAMTWLGTLERGQALTVLPTGGIVPQRASPPAPRG